MFDEATKIAAFGVFLAAWVFGLSAEKYAPRPDLEINVNEALLPAVPLTAALDGAPAQSPVSGLHVDLGDGFRATLLASYVIEGRVVTRREFRHDATSAVSPLDLGIVWGDLAAPGGTDGLAFRTGHRMIWFSNDPEASLPERWKEQITNNHLIPANRTVNDALMAIDVGQSVRLRGYLVTVTGNRLLPWRSSTRRDDGSVVGGCEIILVTGVEILSADTGAA